MGFDIGELIGGSIKKIASSATFGISDVLLDIVDTATGGSLTPDQRHEIEIATMQEVSKREKIAADAANEAENNVTKRAAELEGTAADLIQAGFLGRVVLFLRGLQRPVWGFGVFYIDIQVFSQKWPLDPNSAIEGAFWVMNLLVLGFLFGERAVKNVMPLAIEFIKSKKAT